MFINDKIFNKLIKNMTYHSVDVDQNGSVLAA
jgi:hypothetical protein